MERKLILVGLALLIVYLTLYSKSRITEGALFHCCPKTTMHSYFFMDGFKMTPCCWVPLEVDEARRNPVLRNHPVTVIVTILSYDVHLRKEEQNDEMSNSHSKFAIRGHLLFLSLVAIRHA